MLEVRLAGSAPLIVKQYADEWRWKQAKEVYVYGLLESHGVSSAPQVVHADVDRAVTVLTLVPGVPLSSASLSQAVVAAYRRMGELLAALHRIEMPAFGYLTTSIVDPCPDNPTYLRAQLDRHLETFAACGGSSSLGRSVRGFVAARAELLAA